MHEVSVEGHPALAAEHGEVLLEVFERHELPVDAACGGFAACNTCRVEVLRGAGNLSARLPEEEGFLDGPDQRLACQARVLGPVSIRLAPGA